MILYVYAIRDNAAGYYLPPSYAHTDAEMMRGIQYQLKQPGMMHDYAADYVLYKVATFDDQNGEIVPMQPVIVARLNDLMQELDKEANGYGINV